MPGGTAEDFSSEGRGAKGTKSDCSLRMTTISNGAFTRQQIPRSSVVLVNP